MLSASSAQSAGLLEVLVSNAVVEDQRWRGPLYAPARCWRGAQCTNAGSLYTSQHEGLHRRRPPGPPNPSEPSPNTASLPRQPARGPDGRGAPAVIGALPQHSQAHSQSTKLFKRGSTRSRAGSAAPSTRPSTGTGTGTELPAAPHVRRPGSNAEFVRLASPPPS